VKHEKIVRLQRVLLRVLAKVKEKMSVVRVEGKH
jgi:hypothetical protein